MHLIVFAYVRDIYTHKCYVCLYVSEMNDSSDTKHRRKKLGNAVILFESELGLVLRLY